MLVIILTIEVRYIVVQHFIGLAYIVALLHRLIRMKYRSRTELASNILEAANGGATKTKIMYKAFLSYAQLKEYLAMLIQNGLMAHDIEGEMYRTTSNGIKFLETSRQLGVLLTPVAPENRLT
jgi:predicted transcriptional regulator